MKNLFASDVSPTPILMENRGGNRTVPAGAFPARPNLSEDFLTAVENGNFQKIQTILSRCDAYALTRNDFGWAEYTASKNGHIFLLQELKESELNKRTHSIVANQLYGNKKLDGSMANILNRIGEEKLAQEMKEEYNAHPERYAQLRDSLKEA